LVVLAAGRWRKHDSRRSSTSFVSMIKDTSLAFIVGVDELTHVATQVNKPHPGSPDGDISSSSPWSTSGPSATAFTSLSPLAGANTVLAKVDLSGPGHPGADDLAQALARGRRPCGRWTSREPSRLTSSRATRWS